MLNQIIFAAMGKGVIIMDEEKVQIMRLQKVVKSNAIINKTRYDLSLQQQKILLFVISRIKPEDTELLPQTFTLSELCDVCGISQSFNNFEYIADNIKKISDISYWIEINDKLILCRWFQEAVINSNNLITITLNKFLTPHLLQLREFFTAYEICYIYPMKSKYSIRFYELLKSNSFYGSYTISVDDLKDKLQSNYARFNNFRTRVLDTAIEEINLYTDLTISYELIKEGKFIESIRFDIREKSDIDQMLTRTHNHIVLESARK